MKTNAFTLHLFALAVLMAALVGPWCAQGYASPTKYDDIPTAIATPESGAIPIPAGTKAITLMGTSAGCGDTATDSEEISYWTSAWTDYPVLGYTVSGDRAMSKALFAWKYCGAHASWAASGCIAWILFRPQSNMVLNTVEISDLRINGYQKSTDTVRNFSINLGTNITVHNEKADVSTGVGMSAGVVIPAAAIPSHAEAEFLVWDIDEEEPPYYLSSGMKPVGNPSYVRNLQVYRFLTNQTVEKWSKDVSRAVPQYFRCEDLYVQAYGPGGSTFSLQAGTCYAVGVRIMTRVDKGMWRSYVASDYTYARNNLPSGVDIGHCTLYFTPESF